MSRCLLLAVAVLSTACASAPDRAYYPPPGDPGVALVSQTLFRAAGAAGDDPARYSFALIQSRDVSAFSADDATFYFSEGLVRQPPPHVEALVAHEVAHEVLGHAGRRRTLKLSLSAGFTVLGILVPGAGLLDLIASPLIVRAFTREQELAADRKGVDILRSMGHDSPATAMAQALTAATEVNGPAGGALSSEPSLPDRLRALAALDPRADLSER
jgi:Zn-dependent protease with chaperone function